MHGHLDPDDRIRPQAELAKIEIEPVVSPAVPRIQQVLAERVKLIPLQGVELWRELGLAYRRDRTHTRPTTTFISTVRQRSTVAK